MTTLQELHDFVAELRAQEAPNENGEDRSFADGSAVFQSFSSARLVAQKFGGQVLGYHCCDNPSATIPDPAAEDGHDFALVASHFIVDYWAFEIADLLDRPVLDLENISDRFLARKLYGDPLCWKPASHHFVPPPAL